MNSHIADFNVILSNQVGNSTFRNPSDINENESVSSTSTLDLMEIDSTYMGVPITGHARIEDDNDEVSDGNNRQANPGGVAIYLDRVFLGRMMIGQHGGSREELQRAVGQFGNLADGLYIFHYKGRLGGYIRIADYQSFQDFKKDLHEVDVVSVGVGEIVNFP